ncbi:MAG: hypothetical protein ACK4MS_09235 [Paracoccaceae bacterium]
MPEVKSFTTLRNMVSRRLDQNERRVQMSRITAFVAALAIVASASVASAGGPVVIEEEDNVIAVIPGAAPVSSLGSGAILAGVAGIALLAAVAKNNSGSH